MATNFSDEARDLLAPVMSDDLSTYLSGIGQMFAEVEEYAREDAGPVYVGPLSDPLSPRIDVAPDNWWTYYSHPVRADTFWDTSVTIDGAPTARLEGKNVDTDRVGIAYQNHPILPGETYVWKGAFIGIPGVEYQAVFSMFENFNAGGLNTTNTLNVIAKEGVTEFELESTVPPLRNFLYFYLLSPLSPGLGKLWLSSKSGLWRRSKAALPVIPWSKILNPEAAVNEAALLYLAQLAGVRVPQGMAFRDMQTFIERAEARRRGRLSYMVELAQATLTGNKFVFTIEREPTAWTLRMVTRLSETPNPAATEAAILRGKPAGIVLDYEAVAGITWDEAVSQWNATGLTWDESSDTVP